MVKKHDSGFRNQKMQTQNPGKDYYWEEGTTRVIPDTLGVAKPPVHSGFIKSIQFLMKGILLQSLRLTVPP